MINLQLLKLFRDFVSLHIIQSSPTHDCKQINKLQQTQHVYNLGYH